MSNLNLRSISNHFEDVRLVSLRSWRQAAEILPRDRGGPYVVLQEGYDPADIKMVGAEFIIGRSGQWLPLAHFYRLSIAERREEFVFGTAAEVMEMMGRLPTKAAILGKNEPAAPPAAGDEMAAAIEKAKTGVTPDATRK
jgi:hypothetical protein